MIPLQKHFFGTLYILTKYALLKRLKKKNQFFTSKKIHKRVNIYILSRILLSRIL